MGDCPCPRCLIPKEKTDQLGTKDDQCQRKNLARKDNLSYRTNISSAREMIYQKNYSVTSKPVDDVLKDESLVPIEVHLCLLFNDNHFDCHFLECILSKVISFWI